MPLIPAHIRAICFDAVGTLIFPDPPAHEVYAAVGRRHGSTDDPATIRRRFVQAFAAEERRDHDAGLQTSEEREEQRWRHIVAAVLDDTTEPEACFRELYEHFAQPAAWRCAAHTGSVLEQLARTYPLALASNYDRRLRSVVAGMLCLQPISHVIISSELGWRKPASQFFAAVCRTLALPPREILFVGDDPANDYEGARAAALEPLLFGPASAGSGEMRQVGDLRELL